MEGIKNNPQRDIEKPPKRVLEIGAGSKSVLVRLKERGKIFVDSVITDFDEEQLGSDSRYEDDKNIQRVVAPAYNLPFKDESFDYIVAANFFGDPSMKVGKENGRYHLTPREYLDKDGQGKKHLRLLFKELARVLSSHGEVCIIESYTPEVTVATLNNYKKEYNDIFEYSEGSNFIKDEEISTLLSFREYGGKIYTLKKIK